MKQKLNIGQQIDNLKNKGVKFNIINEADATEILRNSTYFFKLKAYARNYKKENGLYVDLEFAYLYEMSKIDMYFRRLILNISMDIEHTLKVLILRDFETLSDNGQNIVNSFINSRLGESTGRYLSQNRGDESVSTKLINNNRPPQMPFWILIEVIQLGDLLKLYKYFYGRFRNFYTRDELTLITNCIFSLKCLRNSAAHNNCILINIFDNSATLQTKCLELLSSNRFFIQKDNDTLEEMLKNRAISDFLMITILIKKIVKSRGLLNHIKHEISVFFKQICMTKKRRKYFFKNAKIKNRAIMVYKSYTTILSSN